MFYRLISDLVYNLYFFFKINDTNGNFKGWFQPNKLPCWINFVKLCEDEENCNLSAIFLNNQVNFKLKIDYFQYIYIFFFIKIVIYAVNNIEADSELLFDYKAKLSNDCKYLICF